MLMDLQRISQKISDYKVCEHCNHLNWYENNECCICQNKTFSEKESDVDFAVKQEYKFWVNEEKYTEEQADNIDIEV
jgi:ribosomal protein L40E